jgi:long-chain fatty acid transport protein
MKTTRIPFYKVLISSLVFLIIPLTALGSGFRIPEISITGLGTSNALVANSQEPGALPYNPSGTAFHDNNTLVAGVVHIDYDLSVDPAGGSETDNTGKKTFLVPNLFLASQASDKWSFGLAINAPFGLETRWPDETFPTFAGAADGLEPEHSKIKMININPNLSYRAGENTSVAFGILFYDVSSLVFNTQGLLVSGAGTGYGWAVSGMHKTGNWSFGASYKSSVETDLKGTYDATGLGSTASAASAKLEFPDMLQIGAHYQINQAWGIELDVERTGWSSFDQIDIHHSSPGISSPTTSTNNWDDAWAYRLGAIWQINANNQLRFGYSYDQTPQGDDRFSARVPDNDRQLFSIGYAHDFQSWSLEAGYMYVKVDDRNFNTSVPYGTYGTDANGTSAYNGTYKNTVQLIGLGISTTF